MKAIAIPIIGTMLVAVSVVMLFLYFNGTVYLERSVMEKGETALSFSHDTELVRKMIVASVETAATRAAYELGRDGGGFEEWNSTNPTIDQLRKMVAARTIGLMGHGGIELNEWQKLDLNPPEVDVEYNRQQCRQIYASICFFATGYQLFLLTDERVLASAEITASFDQKVDSTYFKLVHVGRTLADEIEIDVMNGYNGKPGLTSLADYSDEQQVIETITNVTDELDTHFTAAWPGLQFVASVEWDGTDEIASIKWHIRDESSFAPIRSDEPKICPSAPQNLDCLHLNFTVEVHA